jgi:hypothetical protein
MRENRTYGSEGGEGYNPSRPLSGLDAFVSPHVPACLGRLALRCASCSRVAREDPSLASGKEGEP